MYNHISSVYKSINYTRLSHTTSELLTGKCFRYIGILFVFCVTPLILTNDYYYHDDMCRAINGDIILSKDGRPIGEIFYRIFSLGKQLLIDVYPFPLIVSLFLLALVFALLYRRFGNNRPWIFSLSIFPILASPPFLENLRWRFDSAFMILSLVFAIFPYVVSARNKLFWGVGVISLICAACSYQPALNVFIGAAALEGYYILLVKQDIKICIKHIFLRTTQLAISLLIYLKLIIPYLALNSYYTDYSRPLPINSDFFPKLFNNILAILHIPNLLLRGGMQIVYTVMCISFLAITAILWIKYCTEKKPSLLQKMTAVSLLGAQCITAGTVALCGIIMFSIHPNLEPRVYLGWGMFVSFLLLPYCWVKTRHLWALVLVPFLYAWTFLTMDFAVSNAGKEEHKYRNNLATSIIKDLDLLKLNHEKIIVSGSPPAAPTTRNLIQVFPLIRKLIDRGYEADFLFIHGSGRSDYAPKLSKQEVGEMEKLTPLCETLHYKFYKFNNAIVIRFPESKK